MTKTIYLKDFSEEPFGRYIIDGAHSGESFRVNEITPLIKKIKNGEIDLLIIDIDNIKVDLGSSFIEEAFGGLIRHNKLTREFMKNHIKIKTSDTYDEKRISKYINDALNRNLTI